MHKKENLDFSNVVTFNLDEYIGTVYEQINEYMRSTYVRKAFQQDIPDVFSGTVEVDETYIGGQWKNKRQGAKADGSKRGRGTSKTPVFGILCWGGKVWAQVVPDVEAKTLMPLISRRVEVGSTI